MHCCLAAHKERVLLPFLAGDAAVVDAIEEYVFLLLELHEHPLFRFDWAKQVRDGIMSAWERIAPSFGFRKQ